MKRCRLFAFVLVVAVILSLASCSSSSSSNYAKAESAAYDADMAYSGGWGAAEESYDAPAEYAPDTSPEKVEASNDLASRKIIKNADLSFETTAYDEFLASLNACVAQYGGYTEASETYGGGSAFMLYGTQGTLWLDDPNDFGGPLLAEFKGSREKVSMPLMYAYDTNSRGLGAADLAYAIRNGRPPRCLPEMALHTFEAACGIVKSGETDAVCHMTTRTDRPAPFEPGHTEYPEAVMDL